MKKILLTVAMVLMATSFVASEANAISISSLSFPNGTPKPGAFINVGGSGFTCGEMRRYPTPYLKYHYGRDPATGVYIEFVMFLEIMSVTDTAMELRVPSLDSYNFINSESSVGSHTTLNEVTRDFIEDAPISVQFGINYDCGEGLQTYWYSPRVILQPAPSEPEIYKLTPLDVVAGNYFRIYGSGFRNDSEVAYEGMEGVSGTIEHVFEDSTSISARFPETMVHDVYTIYVKNPTTERIRLATSTGYLQSNGIGINVLPKIMTAPLQRQTMTRPSSPQRYEVAPAARQTTSPVTTSGSGSGKSKSSSGKKK